MLRIISPALPFLLFTSVAATPQPSEAPPVSWVKMQKHITSAFLASTGTAKLVASSQSQITSGSFLLTTFWVDGPAHYRCFDAVGPEVDIDASRCEGPSTIKAPPSD